MAAHLMEHSAVHWAVSWAAQKALRLDTQWAAWTVEKTAVQMAASLVDGKVELKVGY